jgi:hypothetical protein
MVSARTGYQFSHNINQEKLMKKQFFPPTRKRVTIISIHACGICEPVSGPEAIAAYSWLALDQAGEEVSSGHGWLGNGESWTQERADYTAISRGLNWADANKQRGLLFHVPQIQLGLELTNLVSKIAGQVIPTPSNKNRATLLARATLNEIKKHSAGSREVA